MDYQRLSELDKELLEYRIYLSDAIALGRDKTEINMWRRAIQTVKIAKRRITKA